LCAYPSLANPKLFSLLIFEFPTLISFVTRLQAKLKPITISKSLQPTLKELFLALYNDPISYTKFIFGESNLLAESEQAKEE
jgi:hypothetical protein